jgi:FkbM family methyltransferase
MGNGADKILDLCNKKDIKVSGVFASDEFARGNSFRGFKVKKLAEIEEEFKDFCIITAFATREVEVIDRIYKLNEKYELFSPNFPVFGDEYPDFDFFAKNVIKIEQMHQNVTKCNVSRETFVNTINFYISGKLKYLRNIETLKSDALDLLDLQNELHYIDVGAYNGDTIFELIKYFDSKNINLNKVTAFEPDKKNFEKLEKNLSDLIIECELYNIGLWSGEQRIYFSAKSGRNSSLRREPRTEFVYGVTPYTDITKITVNSLDNILKNDDLNGEILIKYDVEGAEYEALLGSAEIIKKYSPKLIVSLYHRNEDIFKLPLLINNINPNYNFYIRKHKYIPCWDLNLYAVPKSI